ncbi:hypothetical protein ACR78Z_23630 [Sphingobacterium thalpophilum]|uniref:Uncharacterized protein n=1 Tax=Sphingobacterium thalpophilum TaxID=259 RepID=A0ABV4HCR9_9SPHI
MKSQESGIFDGIISNFFGKELSIVTLLIKGRRRLKRIKNQNGKLQKCMGRHQ